MSDWTVTPHLTGNHVELVPMRRDHAPALLAAADDDAVFAWLPVDRPRVLADAEAMVERALSAPGHAWVQVDRASGDVAGMTTYYDVSETARTVAIGWTWLGRRFWRTGVNTEAKLLLLRHAFDALGCVRVVWHTDEHNHRSQAAIARLGAQREGVLRKHKQRRDGSWRDTHLFSMLDDEWPEARQALERRLRER